MFLEKINNDLHRTLIGITQEQQNRAILESMNRRAELQQRLQQALEGLSVAAISYYLFLLSDWPGKLRTERFESCRVVDRTRLKPLHQSMKAFLHCRLELGRQIAPGCCFAPHQSID